LGQEPAGVLHGRSVLGVERREVAHQYLLVDLGAARRQGPALPDLRLIDAILRTVKQ
jgi:hypothetical protein